MQIDLRDEELALLRELLDSAQADLREEIYKTEGTDFKKQLKQREETLQAILAKIAGS